NGQHHAREQAKHRRLATVLAAVITRNGIVRTGHLPLHGGWGKHTNEVPPAAIPRRNKMATALRLAAQAALRPGVTPSSSRAPAPPGTGPLRGHSRPR